MHELSFRIIKRDHKLFVVKGALKDSEPLTGSRQLGIYPIFLGMTDSTA